MMGWAAWGLLLLTAVLNATAQFVAKQGLIGLGDSLTWRDLPRMVVNPWLIGAVAIQALAVVLWFMVLSRVQLNVAVPILIGLVFALVMFGSVILFPKLESLTVWKLAGAALIALGVVLLSWQPR
jgi:multidrug transporter EmrE-like cation transporter